MTAKIAIVDIDGVLADGSKRFEEADKSGWPKSGPGANDYWDIVFNKDLIAADTCFEGVNEKLLELKVAGFDIFLVSSRPERLYLVTEGWLSDNQIVVYRALILKPEECQYTKTPAWKASLIHALVLAQGDLEHLILVDDEQANRWAAQNALARYERFKGFRLDLAGNMEEAQACLNWKEAEEVALEDVPF